MVVRLEISAHRLSKCSGAGCITLLVGMASMDITSVYSASQQEVMRALLFPGVGLGGAHGRPLGHVMKSIDYNEKIEELEGQAFPGCPGKKNGSTGLQPSRSKQKTVVTVWVN